MKRIAKMTVLFYLSLALLGGTLISCSHEDSDSNTPQLLPAKESFDSTSFTLGKTVKYTDETGAAHDYEVVKNSFLTSVSANIASRAAAAAWETTNRYQNDEIMYAKIKEYTGLEEYIAMYEITIEKDASTTGVADLQDKYLFLNKAGEKLCTFAFRWSSSKYFTNAEFAQFKTYEGYNNKTDNEIRVAEFAKLTETQIRSRDPERFRIYTTANYSSDPKKAVGIDIVYARAEDKSVDFTNNETISKKLQNHYITIDGKILSPYKTETTTENGKNEISYNLLNSVGSYCEFAKTEKNGNTTYDFRAKGTGDFGKAASVAELKGRIFIKSLSYKEGDSSSVSFETRDIYPTYQVKGSMIMGENNSGGVKISKKESADQDWQLYSQHVNFFSMGEPINFLTFSNEEVSITDGDKRINVPAKLIFFCSAYTGELAEYAKIEFINPQLKDGAIFWTPDIEGYIQRGIEAYKKFYKPN